MKAKKSWVIWIILVLILAILVAVTAIRFSNDDAKKYQKAVDLIGNKQYAEAYDILSQIDYSDSKDMLEYIAPIVEIMRANVGDSVTFGSYEQDGDASNGSEPIEWVVLANQDGKVLVVSEYALDCLPYNEKLDGSSWEASTIKAQLEAMADKMFTVGESELLRQCQTDGTVGISLLSADEVRAYLSDVKCTPTDHAVAQGAYKDQSGRCMYWLKDSGLEADRALYVYTDGSIDSVGYMADGDMLAVRPTLTFNFN